jgi:hypothetical protein
MNLSPSRPALGSRGVSSLRWANCFTTAYIFLAQANERAMITCQCVVKLSTRLTVGYKLRDLAFSRMRIPRHCGLLEYSRHVPWYIITNVPD